MRQARARRQTRRCVVRLDGAVDWAEVAALCEDAYCAVAPAALVARLDGP
jgi:hypothetical protein